MKIKKDWFGMFSSTREYARSIYVREPTEEVEKRIWTKRIKTAGVLMAALLLSFLYCLFQPSDTQEILDGYVVRRQEQEQSLAVTAESNDGQKLWKKELELIVSDRDFTEKEKENLDGKTKKYLESELLGENQSLQHVDKPLHLPDSMPSTQMEIHWTVEDTYLSEDGSLCKEQIPKSGVDTEVTAEASWKNWKKVYSFSIHIAPVKWSEKSLWEKNVEQAVAKQMEEQAEKLKSLDDNGTDIMINMGNDYAVAYADMVTNMDLEGTEYSIIDKKIPFYQLAIHGYVNYTGEALNLTQNTQNELLNSAEYGAGLAFTFMKESAFELQNTLYTEYFGADYSAWHDEMLEIYTRYNEELGHTFNQKMVGHEYVTSELTCTIYEDGTKVYVNYSYDELQADDGTVVPARDYVVVR